MATNEGFSSKSDEMYEKIGKLSRGQRIGIMAGTVVLMCVIFFFLGYMPLSEELDSLGKERDALKKTLVIQKKKAAQYARYKKEMDEAQDAFNVAMNKLPDKREIPVLLSSISGAAKDAGLEILMFQPQAISLKEFYAEIPVAMNVKGSYHKAALFFDNVSRLSRIVNIKNILLKPDSISCTAVTYMFVEPKETKKKKK